MQRYRSALTRIYRLGRKYISQLVSEASFILQPAYGFLSGKAVRDAKAGNVGLRDREFLNGNAPISFSSSIPEREALRWIQKYIPAFGGDPTKVTM